jgi:hypothetical protein
MFCARSAKEEMPACVLDPKAIELNFMGKIKIYLTIFIDLNKKSIITFSHTVSLFLEYC